MSCSGLPVLAPRVRKFFVRADDRSLFAVQIHGNSVSMHEAIQELRGFRHSRRTRAACLVFTSGSRLNADRLLRRAGVLGVIFIQQCDALGPVVVHELFHAVVHYARVRRIPFRTRAGEERLAGAIERMHREYFAAM